MANFCDFTLLKGLQTLLNPKENSGSDTEEDEEVFNHKSSPLIKKPPPAADYQNPYKQIQETRTQPKTIDDWNRENGADLSSINQLPSPEYEIIYKQRVNTEDVFLQMGNKTPATSSCEDIIVKIHLRKDVTESAAQMQLDIEEQQINLLTKSYQLNLTLPHPVDPDQGSAKWDIQTEIFTVTLRMKRELDFVNF